MNCDDLHADATGEALFSAIHRVACRLVLNSRVVSPEVFRKVIFVE